MFVKQLVLPSIKSLYLSIKWFASLRSAGTIQLHGAYKGDFHGANLGTLADVLYQQQYAGSELHILSLGKG